MSVARFCYYAPLMGLIMFSVVLGFSGCKSKLDEVAEKPIPVSPNYREDEQIRLQLFVEDVLQLEKTKQYGALYDRYTSWVFKESISRRNFLRVSQCVEESLGELKDYDRKNWVFQKKSVPLGSTKQPPVQPPQIVHLIERKVTRSKATLMERFSIASNGLEYQLSGLYWMTKKNDFLTCVKNLNPPNTQASPSQTKEKDPGQSEDDKKNSPKKKQ
jgi:hypothetical protein